MAFDDADDRPPPAASPATSTLAELESYWRSLRRQGGLPARTELDPSRIDKALPHAFILERVAPGVARLRVAGQALSAHLGTEARGMPLSALFGPESRERIAHWLDRTFDGPSLVDLSVRVPRGPLRHPVRGRLLLLPLLDAEGKVTRALGALLLDGSAGRGPVRFDLSEDMPMRCEEVRRPPAPAREGRPGAAWPLAAILPGPALAGMAEAPRPFAGRPHLRLVVSND